MAFEEFYQSVYHDFFFKWIILNSQKYLSDHVVCKIKEETDQYKSISFEMQKVTGLVTIWYNNIVEEQILDIDSNDLLFYLHYKIIDLAHARNLFEEFYHTLLKHNNQEDIYIALCSSDGFSTTIFVEEMSESCQLEKSSIHLESIALDQLPNVYQHYNMLYLAPQIAHLEPEIIEQTKHQIPIYQIDPMIFATKDYQSMLRVIIHHLNQ